MHQTILLYDVDVGTALDMKHELERAGLVMNQDFSWAFQQARWDNFSHEPSQPRYVKFEFVNPAMATYYQLKWTQ